MAAVYTIKYTHTGAMSFVVDTFPTKAEAEEFLSWYKVDCANRNLAAAMKEYGSYDGSEPKYFIEEKHYSSSSI
jgi:hypothetical protein